MKHSNLEYIHSFSYPLFFSGGSYISCNLLRALLDCDKFFEIQNMYCIRKSLRKIKKQLKCLLFLHKNKVSWTCATCFETPCFINRIYLYIKPCLTFQLTCSSVFTDDATVNFQITCNNNATNNSVVSNITYHKQPDNTVCNYPMVRKNGHAKISNSKAYCDIKNIGTSAVAEFISYLIFWRFDVIVKYTKH